MAQATSLTQLKSVYKKQSVLRARLNSIDIFIKQFKVGDNLHEVKNRIRDMPEIKSSFEELCMQAMLLSITDSDGDEDKDTDKGEEVEINEMEAFEKRYYSLLSKLQSILERATSHQPVSQVLPNHVRLPVINLPEFGGAYKDWLPFFYAFNSLIHQNKTLDSCQKFHYLKSCLKGEAFRAIDSLTISNANYTSAWTLLQKRYKNERLIVQSHVQAILNSPEITKCTADSLRKLVDDVTSNVEALKVLKVPVESNDAFIVTIVTGKLDYQTRKEFENTLDARLPSRRELIEFLDKKCTILDSMSQNAKSKPVPVSQPIKKSYPINRSSHVVTTKFGCHFCKQRHFINQCDKFLALSLSERQNEVKQRNLCFNCLRNNHVTSNCKASGCMICQAKTHHTLLHDCDHESSKSKSQTAVPAQTPGTSKEPVSKASAMQGSANHCSQREPKVILSTAIVLIKYSSQDYQECRSLLDVGSQLNLMSEAMCEKLNLKTRNAKIAVWGVNQTCSRVTKTAEITVRSVYYPYEVKINCYITQNVAVNIPINSFDKLPLGIPSNVNLADPNFNLNGPIDLILSAEVFWGILGTERIKLIHPSLYLTETWLGWVIGGALTGSEEQRNDRACNFNAKINKIELSELMERFWVQEELIEPKNTRTNEEIECENHFLSTFKRDSDGRFIVHLPFKNNTVNLGDSSRTALKRFISLEKKFRQDPEFRVNYSRAFNENLKLGIIEEIPEGKTDSSATFYLPHSGVVKKTDKGTKIRIVFDGSAKSSNGMSLNDNLMTGPNLQNDLFEILARFRIIQVVISCDMEKMFLQVKVHEPHTNYQRLFWRNTDGETIKEYRITRLMFGSTYSPYAAMRCIQQLAQESAEEFPVASRVLIKERFMDDILSGAANIEEAIKLRDQITLILDRGCFTLSKWTSNDPRVLPKSTLSDDNLPLILNSENTETSKILGLWWNPKGDTLSYRVEPPDIPEVLTKRIMLSSIAKLYDPIGIISPVIVKAKILMQSLWSLNLDWDQNVPNDIKLAWEKYVKELDLLNDLRVPRKAISDFTSEIELLAFCDASLRAYGAMIYVRSKNKNGTYCINLLCSKSRVSPIKVLSLPRLELCAALLAARLMKKVSDALNTDIRKKYYFSDSTVVLHYINANANSWQVFVANRVAKIQTLCDVADWYHVRTELNPADLISRGVYPKQIMNSKLYWHGPEFLTREKSEWPNLQIVPAIDESEILERRKIVLTVSVSPEMPLLSKFSTFTKLERVMAYVLRFINNAKGIARLHGVLTIKELTKSHDTIIKIIQNREFVDDFAALNKGQSVSKQSKLKALDPFIDKDGILRVGGRLRQASLPFIRKHPAILPSKHHVLKLLIRREHIFLLHAGPTQTLASLRGKYWPLRGKDEVRNIIHSCLKCFRTSPKLMYQKMGDLPPDRVEPCRPFLKIGLDYFGPLYLKQGKRSTSKVKTWGALFVCMVTRAIHLEVVSDLTSESFLNALKRLIARRGKISHIYCDNATTFVGAKAELREIHTFLYNDQTQADIYPYLSVEGISWNFIPPRSPNFGGLWERLVRSTKQHLKKVTSNALLTFEEASTLLTQIEAVINSRPLTTLSNDPSDFEVLTPSHFLIGESLMELPEYDIRGVPDNRLNRWQRIQKLKQQFWNRFSKEVLVQLQHRQKWHHSSPIDLKVGTLVLLSDDTPPMVWKMGRIVELFPGADGIIRVATVRTSQGTYKRSIRRLAIIPVDNADLCCEVRE